MIHPHTHTHTTNTTCSVSTSAVTAGEPLFDSWVTLTTCLTVPQSCSAEKSRNRKRNTNWKYMSLCSASSLCCCVRGWQNWGQDHEIQTYNTASCGLCFKFSQLQSIFSEDFVLALNSSQMHDNCNVFWFISSLFVGLESLGHWLRLVMYDMRESVEKDEGNVWSPGKGCYWKREGLYAGKT